jgi:hypothetical protein
MEGVSARFTMVDGQPIWEDGPETAQQVARDVRANIVQLVPPPSASQEAVDGAVQILRLLLVEAEAGRLADLAVIYSAPDKTWSHITTTTIDFTGLIGRTEIAKQRWIEDFQRQQEARAKRP